MEEELICLNGIKEEEFISYPEEIVSDNTTSEIDKDYNEKLVEAKHSQTKDWKSLCWTCFYCSKVFNDLRNLKVHQESFHQILTWTDTYFECFDCNEALLGYSTFLNHIRCCHYEELKLCCDVCNEVLPDYEQLSRHRDKHNEILNLIQPTVYHCTLCEEAYCTEKLLKHHIQESHSFKSANTLHSYPNDEEGSYVTSPSLIPVPERQCDYRLRQQQKRFNNPEETKLQKTAQNKIEYPRKYRFSQRNDNEDRTVKRSRAVYMREYRLRKKLEAKSNSYSDEMIPVQEAGHSGYLAPVTTAQLTLTGTILEAKVVCVNGINEEEIFCPSEKTMPERNTSDNEKDYNEKLDDAKYSQIEDWKSLCWACFYCNKGFNDFGNLKAHQESIHEIFTWLDTYFECFDCKKVLLGYSSFLNHIRGFHYEALKFCCDVCNKILLDYEQLSRHRDDHNEISNQIHPTVYHCTLCEEVHSTEKLLKHHIQESHNFISTDTTQQNRLLSNANDEKESYVTSPSVTPAPKKTKTQAEWQRDHTRQKPKRLNNPEEAKLQETRKNKIEVPQIYRVSQQNNNGDDLVKKLEKRKRADYMREYRLRQRIRKRLKQKILNKHEEAQLQETSQNKIYKRDKPVKKSAAEYMRKYRLRKKLAAKSKSGFAEMMPVQEAGPSGYLAPVNTAQLTLTGTKEEKLTCVNGMNGIKEEEFISSSEKTMSEKNISDREKDYNEKLVDAKYSPQRKNTFRLKQKTPNNPEKSKLEQAPKNEKEFPRKYRFSQRTDNEDKPVKKSAAQYMREYRLRKKLKAKSNSSSAEMIPVQRAGHSGCMAPVSTTRLKLMSTIEDEFVCVDGIKEEKFISPSEKTVSERNISDSENGYNKKLVDAKHSQTKDWKSLCWTCFYCSKGFNEFENLKAHQSSFHQIISGADTNFECFDCRESLLGYSTFLNHIRGCHYEALKLCCDVCNALLLDYEQLSRHRDEHNEILNQIHPTVYHCTLCEEVHSTEKLLKHHIQESHNLKSTDKTYENKLLSHAKDEERCETEEGGSVSIESIKCEDEYNETKLIVQSEKHVENVLNENDLKSQTNVRRYVIIACSCTAALKASDPTFHG